MSDVNQAEVAADLAERGVWRNRRTGKEHLLVNLRAGVLASLTRNAWQWSQGETRSQRAYHRAFVAMSAVCKTRGITWTHNAHDALVTSGGACAACGAVAHYIVGSKGYCRKHHGRALLMRRCAQVMRERANKDFAATYGPLRVKQDRQMTVSERDRWRKK